MNSKLNRKKGFLFRITDKKLNRICFLVFTFLSIAVMIIIFLFSNQTAYNSANLSDNLSGMIVDTIIPNAENERALKVLLLGIFMRKFAHFVLYAALGLFLAGAAINVKGKKLFPRLSVAAIIGLFYSITDEFHQLFSDGRSAQLTDVLLDFSGVIVGIIITLAIYKIICISAKNNKNL